jgi:hypothetical protein
VRSLCARVARSLRSEESAVVGCNTALVTSRKRRGRGERFMISEICIGLRSGQCLSAATHEAMAACHSGCSRKDSSLFITASVNCGLGK